MSKKTVFSAAERELLKDLVYRSKVLHVRKKNDKVTNIEKNKAWEEVTREFNAGLGELAPKTVAQLKKLWENIKFRNKVKVEEKNRSQHIPVPVTRETSPYAGSCSSEDSVPSRAQENDDAVLQDATNYGSNLPPGLFFILDSSKISTELMEEVSTKIGNTGTSKKTSKNDREMDEATLGVRRMKELIKQDTQLFNERLEEAVLKRETAEILKQNALLEQEILKNKLLLL